MHDIWITFQNIKRDFISKNNQYIYKCLEKPVPLECIGLESLREILKILRFTGAAWSSFIIQPTISADGDLFQLKGH